MQVATGVGIESHLRLPAAITAGICSSCRGLDYDGLGRCGNCRKTSVQLGAPLVPALPISTYRKPSQMRDWLTQYKPNAECPPDPAASHALVEVLGRFIAAAPRSLWDAVDVITTVPSTSRIGDHPLLPIVEQAQQVRPVQQCLVRAEGPLGHGCASRAAFVAIPGAPVAGRHVLLIDDVYTTGARAQSAARALLDAGASKVTLLVLARRLNPEYHPMAQELWDRLDTIPYSFARAVEILMRGT